MGSCKRKKSRFGFAFTSLFRRAFLKLRNLFCHRFVPELPPRTFILKGTTMISSRILSAARLSTLGLLAASATLSLVGSAQTPATTSNPSAVYSNPRAAADDPRIGLKPGLYDAGEAASGLQLLTLVKKPGAFIPPPAPEPAPGTPAARAAGLTYANSDLAFSGKYAFMGNFYGITIYDVTNPASAKLITTIVCP